MGDLSPVSRRSSHLFGIHSESRALRKIEQDKRRKRRLTVIVAAGIFILLLILMGVVMIELYTNATIDSLKTNNQPKLEHLEEILKAQKWNMIQDIVLEPQMAEKRWDNIDEGDHGSIVEKQRAIDRDARMWKMVQDIKMNPGDNQKRWNQVVPEENKRRSFMRVSGVIRGFDMDGNVVKQHANHRYHDEPTPSVKRVGWQPRPFTINQELVTKNTSEKGLFVNSSSHNPLSTSTLQPPHPTTKPSDEPKRPLRFRGYYMHPPQKQDFEEDGSRNDQYFNALNAFFRRQQPTITPNVQKDSQVQHSNVVPQLAVPGVSNEEYHQRINEFFKDFKAETGDQKGAKDVEMHKVQANKPTELHTQAIFHTFKKTEEDSPKTWNRKKTQPRPKPFTVMLDIYPMNKEDGHIGEVTTTPSPPKRRPQNGIFIPMRPGAQYFEPMVAATRFVPTASVPQKQNQNRMIMKLNLFPKAPERQRRTWFGGGEEEEDDEAKCGWKRPKKPIQAKWKTKNGDWMHAKYVTIKEWDDRMDHLDPR